MVNNDSNNVQQDDNKVPSDAIEDKKKVKKKDSDIKELETKVIQLEEQCKRAVADYRNLERRVEQEKSDWIKFANKELLLKLFGGLEALFLAEKHVEDAGLKLSIKKMRQVLKDAGVERIETEGKKYDPLFMECVEVVEGEENTVVSEVRPGFTLYGTSLQPALVKVGKIKDKMSPASTGEAGRADVKETN